MPPTNHYPLSALHPLGARHYNSLTSTWLSVDPLSDKYPSTSPYVYCRNNPIAFIDPDGMFDTRSQARQYRREHHTGGLIRKSDNDNFLGNYSIYNKRKGVFYTIPNYQNNESTDILYGQNNEQVVCGVLITPQKESRLSSNNILASTFITCGILVCDDATGIGVADDIAIPVIAAIGTTAYLGTLWFEHHKQNVSKSNWQRHSATRSGGDPATGRYGQNRNDSRGNKNRKHIPSPNPNKRK